VLDDALALPEAAPHTQDASLALLRLREEIAFARAALPASSATPPEPAPAPRRSVR
jgi:hypothetical protein